MAKFRDFNITIFATELISYNAATLYDTLTSKINLIKQIVIIRVVYSTDSGNRVLDISKTIIRKRPHEPSLICISSEYTFVFINETNPSLYRSPH